MQTIVALGSSFELKTEVATAGRLPKMVESLERDILYLSLDSKSVHALNSEPESFEEIQCTQVDCMEEKILLRHRAITLLNDGESLEMKENGSSSNEEDKHGHNVLELCDPTSKNDGGGVDSVPPYSTMPPRMPSLSTNSNRIASETPSAGFRIGGETQCTPQTQLVFEISPLSLNDEIPK